MTLITEPKSPYADSYVSVEEADVILSTQRLDADAWDEANVARKEVALRWATSLLDNSYEWYGTKATSTQRLRWPRYGVIDADGYSYSYDLIPELIKRATAEFALELLIKNRTDQEPDITVLGVSEVKIGPLEVKINSSDIPVLFPSNVTDLLLLFGTLKGQITGSGSMVRKLTRA